MIDSDKRFTYDQSISEIKIILEIEDCYKSRCKTWCEWLKNENLGISLYSLKKYYWFLINNAYNPSTINTSLVMMKNRFIHLFDLTNNMMDKKALLKYKLELYKAPPKVHKSISKDKLFSKNDVNILISSSGIRTALIIEFLFETGCRRQELCDILIKSCKKRKDKIDIGIYGKGKKYRVLWISKNLYKRLNNIFGGKKYLFETLSGNKYRGHSVWAMVKRAGAVYLDRDLTPHMLRHTFATEKLKEGHPEKAVADYLGHSSTATLNDNYVHVELDHKKILGGLENQ